MFSVSLDGTIREWDFATAKPGRIWSPPIKQRFHALAYDPLRQMLLAVDGTGPFAVFLDLSSGSLHQFTNSPVHAVAFTPGKDRFLRGQNGGFYSNEGGLDVVSLDGTIERSVSYTGSRFAFSPDGRRLATGSWHHRLRVWQWPEMKQLVELGPMEGAVSLEFAPDGRRLVSAGFNGDLKLWDALEGKLSAAVTAHHSTTVGCARFSPDGQWLATAGGDQTLCIWDARRLELKKTLKGHVDQVCGIWRHAPGSFHREGTRPLHQ